MYIFSYWLSLKVELLWWHCKAIANAKAAISVPKIEELIKVGIDWHAPAVKSSD